MKIRLDIKDKFIRISLYTYLILMVFIYGGFVLILNYRRSLSEAWLSESVLTTEDVATISQLGNWSERLELLFAFLFILMSIFYFFKRKVEKSILQKYFMVNIFLAMGILGISFIASRTSTLLMMDLLLPLMNLVSFIFIIPIYILFEWIIRKSFKSPIRTHT
ncbi:hypothetical protein [Sutcliffiella rhizosphaerae]|uniref:Uncharacterized protein n=1 Tax=Sutcliffiella rhizosphaerae TaxID=2880967 RepID=A0ABM8YSX8_9BACI|nr:hypothetical protein [Sutcliffiella rhizosphaerae]CAG9623129.1 hypothetical protein BACCIP111883_03925 [Sutcliffiella rhizosphaerae]